jgi:hypothetical protein
MNKTLLILIFLLNSNFLIAQQLCNAIIYVLSPDCKLCQNKTYDMQETINVCVANNIKVYFFFHKDVDKKKAKKYFNLFSKKNTIHIVFDKNNEILKSLEVNTTPTVLLFDNDCNNIYFGAIDDKDISIQTSKSIKTISFIDTAIKSYLNREKIDISCTTPVGCIFR